MPCVHHREHGYSLSSRGRHTSWPRDWSSDVCSSDLPPRSRKVSARTRPKRPRARWKRLVLRLSSSNRALPLRWRCEGGGFCGRPFAVCRYRVLHACTTAKLERGRCVWLSGEGHVMMLGNTDGLLVY